MALTVASAILFVALLLTLTLYFHRRSARRKIIYVTMLVSKYNL